MPILRNEKLLLALDSPPSGRDAALVSLLEQTPSPGDGTTLCRLIASDAELQAAVLMLTNSTAFEHKEPCETLEAACSLLGAEELIKLALLSIANMQLTDPFETYGLEPSQMWDLSVLAAGAMECAARYAQIPPLLAYAIGLFHAFGRSVLNRYLRGFEGGRVRAPRCSYFELSDWERSAVGIDHTDAATILLEKWNAPEAFYRPIQFQNRPEDCEAGHQSSAALLHICLHMAAHIVLPGLQAPPLKAIGSAALAASGMPWRDVHFLEGPARMALLRAHTQLIGIQTDAPIVE